MSVAPSAEGRRVPGGVRCTRLGTEVDPVIGECIRALGATFVRDEAREAVRGTLALPVIKVAPREAKVVGRLAHGGAVALDAPSPCLLHLEYVLRLKAVLGLEQTILPLLRGRVECASSGPSLSCPTPGVSRLFQAVCRRSQMRGERCRPPEHGAVVPALDFPIQRQRQTFALANRQSGPHTSLERACGGITSLHGETGAQRGARPVRGGRGRGPNPCPRKNG